MPLKTQQIEEPALNLTPMIDIVLLLVIFFMVGTQFAQYESQYEIDLPRVTEAQPLTSLPDELVVSVAEDGTLYIGGESKSITEIEETLKTARDRYADQVVIIRGDAHGPYQHVMTVLSLCKRARISNVQLANRLEEGTL